MILGVKRDTLKKHVGNGSQIFFATHWNKEG
jgi:hypothetical protein